MPPIPTSSDPRARLAEAAERPNTPLNRLSKFRQRRSCLAILAGAFLALGLAVQPAQAQSLDQLRAAGKVGERYDGYVQALDPGTKDFVSQINAKRKKVYAEDAKSTGASIDQVGRVFARQIIAKSPAGTKFLQEDGSWITK